MSNIKYSITFHTDWHCGSGLAAGADVDALVITDEKGMPFIPGKTIKGLIREAVEEIRSLNKQDIDHAFIQTFGYFDKDKNEMERGETFFTNAVLSDNEYDAITSNDAVRFLYRNLSNTAIQENGIAQEHSLRKIQVVVPCVLYGEIKDIPTEEMKNEILQAFGMIKRLGQNRNRGLGRCTIIERKEDTK